MFWSLGAILTNCCALCCAICEEENLPKNDRLPHCESLRDIGLHWMNPVSSVSHSARAPPSPSAVSALTAPSMSAPSTLVPPASANRKRKEGSNSSKGSSNDSAGGERKSRSAHVAGAPLPLSGEHPGRLDHRGHHPAEPRQSNPSGNRYQPKCALHNWALGGQCRYKILHCPACGAHLCAHRYRLWHSEANLVGDRNEIKRIMEEKNKKRKK